MRKHLLIGAILGAITLCSCASALASSIDTTSAGTRWYSAGGGASFGLGQTFIAPINSYLENMTFYIANDTGGGWKDANDQPSQSNVNFIIQEYNGHATGAELFNSGTFLTGNLDGSAKSFNINVMLNPGTTYVAYFDVHSYNTPYQGLTYASATSDLYSDGYAGWMFKSLGMHDGVYGWGWGGLGQLSPDMIFSANFSDTIVPEPSSIAVLGMGIASFAGMWIRKKSSGK